METPVKRARIIVSLAPKFLAFPARRIGTIMKEIVSVRMGMELMKQVIALQLLHLT